jgi:ribosome-associated protein
VPGDFFHLARTKRVPQTVAVAELDPFWLTAVRAADSKQAKDIRVLDLRDVSSFTDTLIICSGGNARQVQAISDEIQQQLKSRGDIPSAVEGYTHAEWILMDYGDYVINIFTDKTRAYYDLERLWRDAKTVEVPAEPAPVKRTRTKKAL